MHKGLLRVHTLLEAGLGGRLVLVALDDVNHPTDDFLGYVERFYSGRGSREMEDSDDEHLKLIKQLEKVIGVFDHINN